MQPFVSSMPLKAYKMKWNSKITQWPNINGKIIVCVPEEQLRSSVISGTYIIGIRLAGIEFFGGAKITDSDWIIDVINENILGF